MRSGSDASSNEEGPGRALLDPEGEEGYFRLAGTVVDGVDKGFRLDVGDVLLPVTVPLLFRPFDPEETTFEFPELDPTPAPLPDRDPCPFTAVAETKFLLPNPIPDTTVSPSRESAVAFGESRLVVVVGIGERGWNWSISPPRSLLPE